MKRAYDASDVVILEQPSVKSVKLSKNHLFDDKLKSDAHFFLFDVSGSMAGTRLQFAKKAAEVFYRNLSSANITRNKKIKNKNKIWDHYCVGVFDTSVSWKTKLNQTNRNGKEGNRFSKQIDKKLKIGGMTAVRDSIITSYNDLHQLARQFEEATGCVRETYLYVLSDEEDNSSTQSTNDLLRTILAHPHIHLNIIHISDTSSPSFAEACKASHGIYEVVEEITSVETIVKKITKRRLE